MSVNLKFPLVILFNDILLNVIMFNVILLNAIVLQVIHSTKCHYAQMISI